MNIYTYGSDKRLEFCRSYLLKKPPRAAEKLILLPIPSFKGSDLIRTASVSARDIVNEVKKGDSVAGYGLPKEFRRELSDKGVSALDIERDEEFVVDNAYLTAVGTVGKLLVEHTRAPLDLSIGVIGYGRIGERLVSALAYLRSEVTVFTSKTELSHELCMLGISGVPYAALTEEEGRKKLLGLDVLINTAPAKIIPEEAAGYLSGVRLIELASGNNFPDGVYYERFASVPAEVYPESAGIAMAKSILRMMGEL